MAKNGGSATYKISEMAAAVGALGASEKLPAAEYPDYVKAGALEVARKVAAVRKSSSIVFAAFSDPHHATDETTGWKTAIETGNRDGCRTLRALAHVLPLDFAVFLGDLTFGYYTTTAAQFEAQCKEFHGFSVSPPVAGTDMGINPDIFNMYKSIIHIICEVGRCLQHGSLFQINRSIPDI